MSDEIEPYENTFTLEELRREVRECWDLQHAIVEALRDLPEQPPGWVQIFLSQASKWPDDNNLGKMIQRKHLDAVYPKTECECGAGVWYRIRQGMLAPRPDKV